MNTGRAVGKRFSIPFPSLQTAACPSVFVVTFLKQYHTQSAAKSQPFAMPRPKNVPAMLRNTLFARSIFRRLARLLRSAAEQIPAELSFRALARFRRHDDAHRSRDEHKDTVQRLVDARRTEIGNKFAQHRSDGNDLKSHFGSEPREHLDPRERAERNAHALLAGDGQFAHGDGRRLAGKEVDSLHVRLQADDVPLPVPRDGDHFFVVDAVPCQRFRNGAIGGVHRQRLHRRLAERKQNIGDVSLKADHRGKQYRQHDGHDDDLSAAEGPAVPSVAIARFIPIIRHDTMHMPRNDKLCRSRTKKVKTTSKLVVCTGKAFRFLPKITV